MVGPENSSRVTRSKDVYVPSRWRKLLAKDRRGSALMHSAPLKMLFNRDVEDGETASR